MLVPIFDLDGTLLDSDAALAGAFVALGVPRESVTFGHVLADECIRLGLSLDDYLRAYDHGAAAPFPGVEDVIAELGRWALCSNKHSSSGRAELARLGWQPDAALFSEDFARGGPTAPHRGSPKRLDPVLEALDLDAGDAIFIGDTDHDRACAAAAGVEFALAGWNPRVRPAAGDTVLAHPTDLLALLG